MDLVLGFTPITNLSKELRLEIRDKLVPFVDFCLTNNIHIIRTQDLYNFLAHRGHTEFPEAKISADIAYGLFCTMKQNYGICRLCKAEIPLSERYCEQCRFKKRMFRITAFIKTGDDSYEYREDVQNEFEKDFWNKLKD